MYFASSWVIIHSCHDSGSTKAMPTFALKAKIRIAIDLVVPGRGVSEKVLAAGFCLGSGLFGSCNSN